MGARVQMPASGDGTTGAARPRGRIAIRLRHDPPRVEEAGVGDPQRGRESGAFAADEANALGNRGRLWRSEQGEGPFQPNADAPECPANHRRTIYPDGIASQDVGADRARRVALLVDYPVLMRAVRAVDAEAVPRLGEIVRAARALGAVHISRAYGAWYDSDEATVAFSEGLDPVFVPPLGPGNVPSASALVKDGLGIVRSDQVEVLALSGDDRLLPLMLSAEEVGLPVALIAHACQPDGPCLKLAVSATPASEFVRSVTRAEKYRRSRSAA